MRAAWRFLGRWSRGRERTQPRCGGDSACPSWCRAHPAEPPRRQSEKQAQTATAAKHHENTFLPQQLYHGNLPQGLTQSTNTILGNPRPSAIIKARSEAEPGQTRPEGSRNRASSLTLAQARPTPSVRWLGGGGGRDGERSQGALAAPERRGCEATSKGGLNSPGFCLLITGLIGTRGLGQGGTTHGATTRICFLLVIDVTPNLAAIVRADQVPLSDATRQQWATGKL